MPDGLSDEALLLSEPIVSIPHEMCEQCVYAGADGAELGYVAYRCSPRRAAVALIYLHGIESHAGWFRPAATLLKERGYDVFCLDRRGSGINRESRGFASGYADSHRQLVGDVDTFVASVRQRYKAVYLIGLSWGGKLALASALTNPQSIDGVILITPGIRSLVDVNLRTKLRIAVAAYLRPRAPVPLPITPEMFTDTPAHREFIRTDPLRLTTASARFLFESRRMEFVIDRWISGNRLPILLFQAGKDRIVDNARTLQVLRHGGDDLLTVRVYEDQTHAIQLDAPERMVTDIEQWLHARPRAH